MSALSIKSEYMAKKTVGRKSIMEDEKKLQVYARQSQMKEVSDPNVIVRESKTAQQLICEQLSVGGYIEGAAAYANISKGTVYNWLKRGRKEKEDGVESDYVSFLYAIEIAMEMGAVIHENNVYEHSKTDWRASAWVLERKFAQRWGKKDTVRLEAETDPNKSSLKDQSINSFIADVLDDIDADKDRWEE
jgi:transposase